MAGPKLSSQDARRAPWLEVRTQRAPRAGPLDLYIYISEQHIEEFLGHSLN